MLFLLPIAAAVAASASPSAAATATVDPALVPYVRPDRLIRMRDGRVLHLRCMGAGNGPAAPTVVLTAGLGEWSATWRRVQPALALRYRTCAWDRPGIGFSSGSRGQQTVVATTHDLAQALRRAGITGPLVLVGHSLGGYETLLFADRYPSRVAGMVLVDPSIPDQITRFRRAAPAFEATIEASNAARTALLRRCARWVVQGAIRPGRPDPDGGLSFPDDTPPALATALARLDHDPARWAANISLGEQFAADARLVINRRRAYRDVPLMVLTSSRLPSFPVGTPDTVRRDAPLLLAELTAAHGELAALSACGARRTVPDSGHYIQIEHPDAVVTAVDQVVATGRAGARASDDAADGLCRHPEPQQPVR